MMEPAKDALDPGVFVSHIEASLGFYRDAPGMVKDPDGNTVEFVQRNT